MNVVFLMKPLSTVVKNKDTSLLFMQACQMLGCNLYFLSQNNATITKNGVIFNVQKFSCNSESSTSVFEIHESKQLHESEIEAVFIRTDPPFDKRYLNDMWVLEQVKAPIKYINHPKGIKAVNEKIWVSQFKTLIPDTCISSKKEELNDFLNKHNKIILKPTDGFGGESICVVTKEDPNKNVLFEMVSENYTNYVIAQDYLPEAKSGDKRILLADGEPVAAILRHHSNLDHRNNFFAGGIAKTTEISERDQHIINKLKPYLLKLGLRFVGIDIIGDYLIEVNVTSPTCLQEYNQLNNKSIHIDLIKSWLNL
jgi:glutathione synthase